MFAYLYNIIGRMAQQIVRQKYSWIKNRVILETQTGKNKYMFFQIKNKELITDVCTYIKTQDDSIKKQSIKKIKKYKY